MVSDGGCALATLERENVDPLLNKTILTALEAIHGKHVLHNDLARRNIVFTGGESARKVQIIDFGEAEVVFDSSLLMQESKHLCRQLEAQSLE